MCGRFVLPDEEGILDLWPSASLGPGERFRPCFNVAPTLPVPLLRQRRDGGQELSSARWGLIPTWWRKDSPPSLTFNARSEEAASKPVWREALRTARGLMPARGWYEWNENEPLADRKGNQPYYLFCPQAPVIAFAALWALWDRPGAAPVLSCALLSKAAAPSISSIHHRMPVVLRPEHHAQWLAPSTTPETLRDLIAEARADLEAYPVSPQVNHVRNDFPELLKKIQPPPPPLDLFGNRLPG